MHAVMRSRAYNVGNLRRDPYKNSTRSYLNFKISFAAIVHMAFGFGGDAIVRNVVSLHDKDRSRRLV